MDIQGHWPLNGEKWRMKKTTLRIRKLISITVKGTEKNLRKQGRMLNYNSSIEATVTESQNH